MYKASEHHGPVVYPPAPEAARVTTTQQHDQPRVAHDKRDKRLFTLSIKLVAYASAVIVVLLFLGITATNLFLAKSYYQGSEDGGLSQRLEDKTKSVVAQLALLQQIVDHVAHQPTTQDILEYQDTLRAQNWALQMRRFLPQALGVAVLANNGTILGEPYSPQLGAQCLTDLARLSQGEHVPTPAVHRDNGTTSHFDLTTPVKDEADNQLGMLFVSFDLSIFQDIIRDATASNQFLVLNDGQGLVIAQQNHLNEERHIRKHTSGIPGTGWTMTLTESSEKPLPSFLSLTIFNISAFLLTVGVIGFLVRYAMCSLGRDFNQVKTLLAGLVEGGATTGEATRPHLRETAQLLPTINTIQQDIAKQRDLLERVQLNDELTGLPNRRQFQTEFTRAYDFARRGTPVCVVLLHIEGLQHLTQEQSEQVIKVFSKTLREHSRKIDHLSRLDDTRFALLLFGMKVESTKPCLERLQQRFHSFQTQHPAITPEQVCSLRIGYTHIHAHRDGNANGVLKRTEEALERAQQAQKSEDGFIIEA